MKQRRSIVLRAAVAAATSTLAGSATSLAISWNATIPADSAISANGLTDQATLFVNENIVNDTADGDRGTGTYLGDGWVLTAQHVITGSGNIYGTNASPGQINYNVIVAGESQDYTADTLVVNGSADIALIHLAGANTGPITTLPGVLDSAIYTGSSEAGQLVQVGGFGTWDPLAATAGTLNSGEIFHRAFNVVASASGAFSNVAANGNSILVNNGYVMGIGEAGDSGSGLWLAPTGNVTDTNLWDYTLAGELNTTSNGNAFGSNNQYERTGGQAGFITSNVYAAHLTVFWDSNPSTSGIQDGSGTWDTTTNDFGNGVSNFAWDNGVTTSNAYFGAHKGAAGTVTLGANITVQNIQFNPATSGTYVIAGSGSFGLTLLATSNIAANGNATISAPITMPSGVSFRPTLGSTLTISGNITGSAGTVSKFQPGILTLSGTNSLSGTFNVGNGATSGGNTDGALRIASNGAINGLTTLDLTDNNGAWGVLQFDGTTANGNLTVPSIGTVGITLNGNNAGPAATATTIVENIGGSNVFTGAITGTTGGIGYGFAVDAGSLTLNSLTTTTTKTLYFRGVGNGSFSGVISGSAVGINQTDTGTWTLNAANTFGVGVTLAGGVLSTTRLGNGSAASGIGESSNVAANLVLTGGTLSFDGSSLGSTNRLFTIGPRGGTLDGSGSVGLNFSQAGSEVSSDATTHAATTVSGSNVVTITAGGETDLAIGMSVSGTGIPSGATITAFSDDAGTITLSAPATAAGSPTLSFGAIARTLTLTGSTAVTNTLTPSLANSAGGGLLGLTKTGAGTWVLAGASSYTGPTLVSVGTLTLNSGESLASLNDTVSGGAIFNISGTLSSSVNLTDNGTINENGTSQTIASLNGSGALNLHGTALTISNGGTFSGVIADTSSGAKLTLTGGVLTVSNVNTYGGGTNINGGTLNFAALGNLGTGAINFGGGTLQYATGNMADISVRTVTFNASGGTIDTNGNSPVAFANPIGNSGVGGITKAGIGTLVLNGASYTGSTSVTGGTLELASGSVASASFSAGVGTILAVDSGVTLSSSSNLSDNGTVNFDNASQTIASLNGAGVLNLNSPTALTVTAGGAFSGVIAGPGSSVTLTGGTLALSGATASTFSGGLNINGGTLNFAALINLGSGGINFGGGTLQYANANMADISTQTVTINAGGGTIDTNGNSPVIFANSIGNGGLGGLTKVGAGTLVLNGASYTGSTNVTEDTLELASGSQASTTVTVGSGAVLTVDSAATLSASTALNDAGTANLNNASQTIATLNGAGLLNLDGTALNITNGGAFSGVITDPAASVTISGGAMVLSGANSYVGDTDVTGGSLEIATPGALASANLNVSAMASLTVDSGATISSSIALGNNGVVNFNNASPTIAALNGSGMINLVSTPLTISGGGAFSGVIADGGGGAGLIISGGTMQLSGSNTFVGSTHVSGGTLTLASNGALASPVIIVDAGAAANINGILNASSAITANGSVTFGVADMNNDPTSVILTRTIGSLAIGSTGNVAVAPATSSATRTALVVTSTLSNSGRLDLANNDMIVKGGNVVTITQQVVSGAITSSTAAAHPFGNTTLAVVLNSGGVFSTFDNQSVSSSDVLVKYTFYGDADLSGSVDASDYILIDSGFNSQSSADPLSGWYNGDFNYDGTINGDDYTLIDNAFNTQGLTSYASVSVGPTEMIAGATEQIEAVPEPASICLLGLVAVLLPRRRRR